MRRALAGVFNVNPPRPKYQDTWDVNVVLLHMQGLGPDVDLSDVQLTRKLAMLLALTTASRASEIQGLNIEYMSDKGDQIAFTIPKLTKTRRPGMKPVTIALRSYQDQASLDVVHCVRVYLRRTVEWRTSKDRHQLLLATVAPHKPVVTSTVSNWLKQLMGAAGIDTQKYQGHSTRSASTSKARAAGLSVAEIVERANWSNARTFNRFYNRVDSVQQAQFDKVVLG